MKMLRRYFLHSLSAASVAVLAALSSPVSAQDAKPESAAPMHIFLLTGQSNMAGRATIEKQDEAAVEGALLWNIVEKKWEAAVPPYNRYSPHRKGMSMQRLNPGPSFVKAYIAANPGVTVGIICPVRGGTTIEQWKKGETEPWPLFDSAVEITQAALAGGGELKGILWHQGEGNSGRAELYPAQLKALIADFRSDLKKPELPFVYSQLGQFNPAYAKFNEMIVKQPDNIPNTACIVTDGLKAIDTAHFDTAGQRALGERYAEAMLELLKKAK